MCNVRTFKARGVRDVIGRIRKRQRERLESILFTFCVRNGRLRYGCGLDD